MRPAHDPEGADGGRSTQRRPPYQGARTGGRSARVRRAVLDAALLELAERGASGVTLPRVAARAGVALSTVHRRWESKERLLAEAIGDLTAQRVPVPDEGDVRADLLALAGSVAAMLSEPVTKQVLRAAFALPEADLATLRARHWGPRYEVAQQVVDRAIARGELPAATAGWAVVEPIHARIWMRALITGLPVDGDFLARVVDQVLASARRGELA